MSNAVQDPKQEELKSADTPMESPEKAEKGKAKMAQEIPMEDDDDEDEEESGAEGDVEEPDEDNMEEIDTDNIVGRRTRGKNIDFAQAAQNLVEEEDDDEEDDEDFEDDDDRMQE